MMEIAKINLKLKRTKKGVKYLDKIISLFNDLQKPENIEKLKKQNIAVSLSIVAEAKFIKSKMVLDGYKKIKLSYKKMNKQLKAKLESIKNKNDILTKNNQDMILSIKSKLNKEDKV